MHVDVVHSSMCGFSRHANERRQRSYASCQARNERGGEASGCDDQRSGTGRRRHGFLHAIKPTTPESVSFHAGADRHHVIAIGIRLAGDDHLVFRALRGNEGAAGLGGVPGHTHGPGIETATMIGQYGVGGLESPWLRRSVQPRDYCVGDGDYPFADQCNKEAWRATTEHASVLLILLTLSVAPCLMFSATQMNMALCCSIVAARRREDRSIVQTHQTVRHSKRSSAVPVEGESGRPCGCAWLVPTAVPPARRGMGFKNGWNGRQLLCRPSNWRSGRPPGDRHSS